MQNSDANFYWFGDSWLYGSELDPAVRESVVFPELVSKHYNANCVNLGQESNGPDILILEFSQIAAGLKSGDIVFFFLSAPHRTFFINDDNEIKRILPCPGFESESFHDQWETYYKYFDSPMQRLFNYDRTINLLWLWCQKLSVKCYFANIFTTQKSSIMDVVPQDAWLVPKDSCIAEFILPHSSDQMYHALTVDSPCLTTQQWREQEKYIEEFIRPGHSHPNVNGHQQIAKRLIELFDHINER